MKQVYTGTVRKGKVMFRPGDRERMEKHLKGLEGKDIEIVMDKYQLHRSDDQIRFYFVARVRPLAEHFGYTMEEMHDTLKAMFLTLPATDTRPARIRSTGELTKDQMTEYISMIEVTFARDYAFEFPERHQVRV